MCLQDVSKVIAYGMVTSLCLNLLTILDILDNDYYNSDVCFFKLVCL